VETEVVAEIEVAVAAVEEEAAETEVVVAVALETWGEVWVWRRLTAGAVDRVELASLGDEAVETGAAVWRGVEKYCFVASALALYLGVYSVY
jgi:hypothetical protein